MTGTSPFSACSPCSPILSVGRPVNLRTLTLSTMLEPSHRLLCVQLRCAFLDSFHDPETRTFGPKIKQNTYEEVGWIKGEYARVQHSLTDPSSRHRRRHLLPTRCIQIHRRLERIMHPHRNPVIVPIIMHQHAHAEALRREWNKARLARDRLGSPACP